MTTERQPSPEMQAAVAAAYAVYESTGSVESIRDARAFLHAFGDEDAEEATVRLTRDKRGDVGAAAQVCVEICKKIKGIEFCAEKCWGK